MDPIIRQIINRDCHVGESYRSVVRHVIGRLRNGYATFRELDRWERRHFIRICIYQHRRNRRVYRAVMFGQLDLMP